MTEYTRPLWLGNLQKPADSSIIAQPLEGEMTPYLGKRYSPEEIFNLDYHNFEDQAKIEWVRAYEIPSLIGKKITVHAPDELSEKMNILIRETLTDIDWEPFEVATSVFRKYLIVHFEIAAPPDLQTGQAMGLEIFADLITVNGETLSSETGQNWKKNQISRYIQAQQTGQPEPELQGEFELEIKSATYSNIRYPGINVPTYL